MKKEAKNGKRAKKFITYLYGIIVNSARSVWSITSEYASGLAEYSIGVREVKTYEIDEDFSLRFKGVVLWQMF